MASERGVSPIAAIESSLPTLPLLRLELPVRSELDVVFIVAVDIEDPSCALTKWLVADGELNLLTWL